MSGPRYVLTVSPSGGEVRVVFGAKVLRFDGLHTQVRTINDLLPTGSNSVRLGWSDVNEPAEVKIARIHEDGTAEVLFRYRIDGVLKPSSGVVSVAVVRDERKPDRAAEAVKLSTFVRKGVVRLTLNGKPLGDYASLEQRDVEPYLREGRNVLKVVWSKDFGSSLPRAELRLACGDKVLAQWSGPHTFSMSGVDYVNFEYSAADHAAH